MGHEASERRMGLEEPGERELELDGLRGCVTLEADGDRVSLLTVENTTDAPGEMGQADALNRSFVCAHTPAPRRTRRPVRLPARVGLESRNTFPVLATEAGRRGAGRRDRASRPSQARPSRGGLYDSTEIEEALLLHVHTLSDGERAAIDAGDPKVRAMIERAAAATPEDIVRLHGVMRPVPEAIPGEDEATVTA